MTSDPPIWIRPPVCTHHSPMPLSDTINIDYDDLLSVVEHIFLPPELPQAKRGKDERKTNVALCHILIQAAAAFYECLSPSQKIIWSRMKNMIESIYKTAGAEEVEAEDLKAMLSGLAVEGGLKS